MNLARNGPGTDRRGPKAARSTLLRRTKVQRAIPRRTRPWIENMIVNNRNSHTMLASSTSLAFELAHTRF